MDTSYNRIAGRSLERLSALSDGLFAVHRARAAQLRDRAADPSAVPSLVFNRHAEGGSSCRPFRTVRWIIVCAPPFRICLLMASCQV
ncbi:MAG: hypothetical protein E6H05_11310 [Bacillati bacterium ANGP1]|uniref:Uncharacterized protein n=1 Tax=Candidatus Segetimicrobium genomatis TaxID=2569760 RepID=A0A537IM43_9BACT|nr:MAG: hypothetical protein E6H05_11310 [Terrabacteria group bacterium ANGP1]